MELIDAFLTGLGARWNHFIWNLDVPCVFGEVVIEFTTFFGKYRSRHTQGHLTNVTVAWTWTQNLLRSTANQSELWPCVQFFHCCHSAPESCSNYDAESKPYSGRLDKVTLMVKAKYVHVHVCVILGKWRPAGRKTRVATRAHDTHVSGKAIANFSNEVSDAKRFPTKGAALLHVEALTFHVLPHVRANGDSPVSWR